MSYKRSYSETITVSGSKTVHYPASQHGGSTMVHYTEQVPVTVNIDVDTNPFDHSVHDCNNTVNRLTGAVLATETAQLVSIDKNSKKIAGTIVDGFFGYIRSEISQQIAELSQNIDAHLMHLKELAKSCLSKKKQMETDYNRIASRYVKIFEDLNNELSNRVYELDKPTFTFKKEVDNHATRTSGNDLVSTITIFGTESGELQSKISASIAKKRAADTITQAKLFLWQQKQLDNTVRQSMLTENVNATRFSPVCFMETQNEKGQIEKNLFITDYLTTLHTNANKEDLVEQFSDKSNVWTPVSKKYSDTIQLYFNAELNNSYPAADQHSTRIKETIRAIADLNALKNIS
ncbi:MAG: hypothetical protein LBT24_00780 [Tannerella sp.]|jgi:hypothetical protein|nr:hypothetical protein [Tannerella sp.]